MESKELAVIMEQSGIEKTKAQTVLGAFSNYFEQASEWEAKTKGLVITDISQTTEMALAREGRLQLKEVRVNAEKTKKKMKEGILVEGRFIDAIYNLIEGITKPIEAELLEKEKFVERIEQAKIEALRDKRAEELEKYDIDTSFYDLAGLSDGAYDQLLENSRVASESRAEAKRKADEEAIAKAKAEEEQRQAAIIENAKLKAEAEAREKTIAAERAKAEAERISEQKKQDAEREKQNELIRIAEEKAEMARLELQAKVDAEKKAIAEKQAAEKAVQEAKAKQDRELAKAGDRGKILAYIGQLELVQLPEVTSNEAKAIIDSLVSAIAGGKSAGSKL